MEHKNLSEIADPALELYREIPEEAQKLFKEIKKYGNKTDLDKAKQQITRALLNVKYNIVQRRIVEEAKVEGLDQLESEEDILDKALELTDE